MSAGPQIAVLDYGMGNLRSVEKALEHVGARAEVTNDHRRARTAAGLVLPGVGAFPRAMQRIGELDLGELIAERLEEGTPTLGRVRKQDWFAHAWSVQAANRAARRAPPTQTEVSTTSQTAP